MGNMSDEALINRFQDAIRPNQVTTVQPVTVTHCRFLTYDISGSAKSRKRPCHRLNIQKLDSFYSDHHHSPLQLLLPVLTLDYKSLMPWQISAD